MVWPARRGSTAGTSLMNVRISFWILGLGVLGFSPCRGQAVDAALQRRIDEQICLVRTWAAEPAIVAAVRAHNTALPPDHAAMTQEIWRRKTVLDPFVRAITRNDVGRFLRAQRSEVVTEAFVSDAAGLKVGFIAKPSSWSHKGRPKHDVPMEGKVWQGGVELDESSGMHQVQVGVPILDGAQAIGSLVVGLSVSRLEAQ